jgi:hypothetical protein
MPYRRRPSAMNWVREAAEMAWVHARDLLAGYGYHRKAPFLRRKMSASSKDA